MELNDKIRAIMVVDETQIRGFFGDYRWLSNFHSATIEFEGLTYPSSEAAYQAAKTLDEEQRKTFTKVTPGDSKIMGRLVSLRSDWEQVKDDIMYRILIYKFTKHPELGQALLDTGDKYLEETNYWNDTYWGVCKDLGQNKLGKLLMKIREELFFENHKTRPYDPNKDNR
jgi:hypothetical protein